MLLGTCVVGGLQGAQHGAALQTAEPEPMVTVHVIRETTNAHGGSVLVADDMECPLSLVQKFISGKVFHLGKPVLSLYSADYDLLKGMVLATCTYERNELLAARSPEDLQKIFKAAIGLSLHKKTLDAITVSLLQHIERLSPKPGVKEVRMSCICSRYETDDSPRVNFLKKFGSADIERLVATAVGLVADETYKSDPQGTDVESDFENVKAVLHVLLHTDDLKKYVTEKCKETLADAVKARALWDLEHHPVRNHVAGNYSLIDYMIRYFDVAFPCGMRKEDLVFCPSVSDLLRAGAVDKRLMPNLHDGFAEKRSYLTIEDKGLGSLEGIEGVPNSVDVRHLSLAHNNLCAWPKIMAFSALQSLNLSNNNVSVLTPGMFSHLCHLKSLRLNSNNISTIPSGAFDGLAALEWLNLSRNNIQELPPDFLAKFPQLTSVDLENNQLRKVPAGALRGPKQLKKVCLYTNNLPSPSSQAEDTIRKQNGLSAECQVLLYNQRRQ